MSKTSMKDRNGDQESTRARQGTDQEGHRTRSEELSEGGTCTAINFRREGAHHVAVYLFSERAIV